MIEQNHLRGMNSDEDDEEMMKTRVILNECARRDAKAPPPLPAQCIHCKKKVFYRNGLQKNFRVFICTHVYNLHGTCAVPFFNKNRNQCPRCKQIFSLAEREYLEAHLNGTALKST